ncbi:hypothetical protein E2C01_026966 [Portunus trituberculatus]|uniref:Uncharacterized protein n=1 Tax=Portunus trituberculatus TaxID=210409 RepID=A0A5B7EGX1_PORTR|nr:hypothetical protein [Portunus trituberculatus]
MNKLQLVYRAAWRGEGPRDGRSGCQTRVPPAAAGNTPGRRGDGQARVSCGGAGACGGRGALLTHSRMVTLTSWPPTLLQVASIPCTQLCSLNEKYRKQTANLCACLRSCCVYPIMASLSPLGKPPSRQARLDPTRGDRGGLSSKGFQSKTCPAATTEQRQPDQPVKGRQVRTSWPAGRQAASGVASNKTSGVFEERGLR